MILGRVSRVSLEHGRSQRLAKKMLEPLWRYIAGAALSRCFVGPTLLATYSIAGEK